MEGKDRYITEKEVPSKRVKGRRRTKSLGEEEKCGREKKRGSQRGECGEVRGAGVVGSILRGREESDWTSSTRPGTFWSTYSWPRSASSGSQDSCWSGRSPGSTFGSYHSDLVPEVPRVVSEGLEDSVRSEPVFGYVRVCLCLREVFYPGLPISSSTPISPHD